MKKRNCNFPVKIKVLNFKIKFSGPFWNSVNSRMLNFFKFVKSRFSIYGADGDFPRSRCLGHGTAPSSSSSSSRPTNITYWFTVCAHLFPRRVPVDPADRWRLSHAPRRDACQPRWFIAFSSLLGSDTPAVLYRLTRSRQEVILFAYFMTEITQRDCCFP